MTAPDVVVLEGVWGQAFDALAARREVLRVPTVDAVPREALSGCRALVVRNRTHVATGLADAAPSLQIVARAGVGLDNLDLPALDAAGVVAVAALGANAASVAEHALADALALAKGLVEADAATRGGSWDRTPRRELAGGVWGLLSAGATARATAALARGLRMSVIAYDPYLEADDPRLRSAGIELLSLDEVLHRADVLSVHLPATAETAGLLDAGALAAMRPAAYLVNVGRGEVVDEDALADALERGHLGGAALDVRAHEPPGSSRLDTAPRTLFSPHVAGITVAAQERIAGVLVREVDAVLDGAAASAVVGSLDRPRPRKQP